MEKVYLQKTDGMTDISFIMRSTKMEWRSGGKSNTVALNKLTDYKNEYNIKRESEIGVIETKNDSILISTGYLNKLKVGEILEIRAYYTYRRLSQNYFYVLENTETHLTLSAAPTAYQIFKGGATVSLKSVAKPCDANKDVIQILETIKSDFNINSDIVFEKIQYINCNTNAYSMDEGVNIFRGKTLGCKYGISTNECIKRTNDGSYIYYIDCLVSPEIEGKVHLHQKKLQEYKQALITKERKEEMLQLLENEKRILISNKRRVMIEDDEGIYLAHPYLLHSDYYKIRFFERNEETLELMRYYNAEVEKLIKTKSQLSEKEKETLEKANRETMLSRLEFEKSIINTNYHKVMIEGHTGIYLAHPYHQHSDYNKFRVFDKNEQTLELMQYFNAEIEAYKNKVAP